MLKSELLKDDGILVVLPEDALQASDFEQLASSIDPYIEDNGVLNGLMIYTESFPGWDNFAGLVSHIKFVKNHHKVIKKVAAVTDSAIAPALPRIASHFVDAEIKHFDYHDKDQAMSWLKQA
ncbi:STAS/SEC14 domain-containing protein [Kaarinaea lacus]